LRSLFHLVICFILYIAFCNNVVLANSSINPDNVVAGGVFDYNVENKNVEVVIGNHAKERAKQRGANYQEIIKTVFEGRKFPAKKERVKFEKTFSYNDYWNERYFRYKKLEVIAAPKDYGWYVITVITKFF